MRTEELSATISPFNSRMVLSTWLTSNACRMAMAWPLFVMTIAAIVLIAEVTMSVLVLKTACTHLADTLKYEQ